MTIKSDKWIRSQCVGPIEKNEGFEGLPDIVMGLENAMIEPFINGQVRVRPKRGLDGVTESTEKVISYGLSSYGYDVRCSDEFKIFTNVNSALVDPKQDNTKCYVDHKGPYCIIPPNSFALAHTVEYFRIPDDVLCIVVGKSTYARTGIVCNVTPIEPGFEGQVVLEFSNTTNLPAKVYANEGVAQFLFFQSDERCETTYKDRGGKYQGQTGIVTAKV